MTNTIHSPAAIAPGDTITPDVLDALPPVVRRYMEWTGVVGQPWTRTAHITQSGRFRQGLDRAWMPMAADQTFVTEPPGMVWNARFKMYGLPIMRARDSYRNGKGHMFGKAAGLFTIFDSRGEELTTATLVRFLSEMIWFPIALLGRNVTWRQTEADAAEVSLSDAGRTVSGIMRFDGQGRPLTFDTLRHREMDGVPVLSPWHVANLDFGERGGLNIPTRGTVAWLLPEGELTYGDFTIVEAEYNRPGDAI